MMRCIDSCRMSVKVSSRLRWLIAGLVIFIACLNFKPSEPYLSQYLICDYDTKDDACSDHGHSDVCDKEIPCKWSSAESTCSVIPCVEVPLRLCGNDDFDYCKIKDDTECVDTQCYESFSEDEVNDKIYPWSTYAYLPFLLILGPFAELFSYRLAILFGICGRVITRFLLLFGKTLRSMQLMQVTYALGTAAEDVFSAYIYYVVPVRYYQRATSYIKAAALTSCVISGILGDVLVVEFDTSLRVLMWISAGFVCSGFIVGLLVIRRSNKRKRAAKNKKHGAKKTQSVKRRPRNRAPAGASSWLTYLGLSSNNHHLLDQPGSKPKGSFSSTSTFAHSYSRARHHSSGGRSEGESSDGGADHEQEEGEEEGGDVDEVEEQEEEDGDSNFIAAVRNALLNTGASAAGATGTPVGGSDHSGGIARSSVKIFRKQMVYLSRALRSTSLVMLLLMWIVGNAAYTILYNYEVSIYQELHGSNEWNGCVLAVMLLVGSLGAMVPAWLSHDKMTSGSSAAGRSSDLPVSNGITATTAAAAAAAVPAVVQPVSDSLLAVRVTAACVLSCGALVLFALFWQTVPSVAFLALYFGTWQYVNVTTFARLALRLKESQLQQNQREEVAPTSRGNSLVESLLANPAIDSISNGDAGAQSMGAGSHASGNFSKFSQYDVVAVSDAFRSQQATGEYIRSRTIDMQLSAGECGGDLSPLTDPSVSSPLLHTAQPATVGKAATAAAEVETVAEPPYSIAIVAIIALCVLVQIVIQLIVFTILELPLRTACLVVILIFVLMSLVYFVYTVLLYFRTHLVAHDEEQPRC